MSRRSTPASPRLPRRGALGAAALAAALTLSGCGGHDEHAAQADSATTGTGADGAEAAGAEAGAAAGATEDKAKFNPADVAFVQGMIPHHQQAIEMSALAKGRTKNPAILKLATGIHGAQDPEIKQMTEWLTAWGKELPSAAVAEAHHDEPATDSHAEGEADGHAHAAEEEDAPHAHGGEEGMMTAAQMAGLKKLKGKAFDKQFLTLMIAHHAGAVSSAKNAIARGINPDVKTLCAAIIKGQTAEIKLMKQLLKA